MAPCPRESIGSLAASPQPNGQIITRMNFSRHSRTLRLAAEGSWILVGQVAAMIGTLVLVRVLTEHLEPAEYGELALGLTIAVLVNQVVMGAVTNGVGRYYSIAVEQNDLAGFLRAAGRLVGYATVAVGLVGVLLVSSLLWARQNQWIGLAAAMILFSVLSGFNSSLTAIQNAARQRSIVALHMGLDAWLKVGLALGAMLWIGASSAAVVTGYSLSALLVTGSQLIFLRRLLGTRIDTGSSQIEEQPWLKQILCYSWPFSVWGMFTCAQMSSDRWALETFATTSDVGHFAAVYQLGYSSTALAAGMVVTLVGPILYQRSGAGQDRNRNESVHRLAWKITGLLLGVTALAFLCALLAHQWLFELLVASPFRSASVYLPWLVLAGGVFSSGQMLGVKLASEMNTKSQLWPKIGVAIMSVVLNITGAWYSGVSGVVASLVVSSFAYFLWMASLALRLPSTIESSGHRS